MRGWYRDNYRHSLAARGYSFKVRAPVPYTYQRAGLKTAPSDVEYIFTPTKVEFDDDDIKDDIYDIMRKEQALEAKQQKLLQSGLEPDVFKIKMANIKTSAKSLEKDKDILLNQSFKELLDMQIKSFEELVGPSKMSSDYSDDMLYKPLLPLYGIKEIQCMGLTDIKKKLATRSTRKEVKAALLAELDRRGELEKYKKDLDNKYKVESPKPLSRGETKLLSKIRGDRGRENTMPEDEEIFDYSGQERDYNMPEDEDFGELL